MRRDTDRRDALSGQLRDAEENVRGAREKLGDVRKRLAESDREPRVHRRRPADERSGAPGTARRARGGASHRLRRRTPGAVQAAALAGRPGGPRPHARLLLVLRPRARVEDQRDQGIVAALDEAAKAEAAERERLAALEAEGRQQLSAVDAARDERSRALKAMNAQIRTRNDSIAKLKREAASLEKLIADLRKAMSDLPPTGGQAFEKVRGRLSWPVAGKITARVRPGAGRGHGVERRADRGAARHAGQGALRGPRGFCRLAARAWACSSSWTTADTQSLYAHNEQLYKAAGDRVKAGEAIATVGDTGGRERAGPLPRNSPWGQGHRPCPLVPAAFP